MSFMYNFGFTGSVAPSGRGFVVSGTASGVTAGGAGVTVGWANGHGAVLDDAAVQWRLSPVRP